MSVEFTLSQTEKENLGDIASLAITAGLAGKELTLPTVHAGILNEHLGSFVTLEIRGRLRGCIGTMIGQEPLYVNVARMAHAAAFNDSRFAPLSLEEWKDVTISISVLGPLTPCPDIQKVIIGRHGLLLRLGARSAVFLPKVAQEQGWDLNTYLENLCHKAGLGSNSWQDSKAEFFWYEALVFDVHKKID